MQNKKTFSDEELKKRLTPIQYKVTQKKGTEPAYSGKFDKFFEKGVYNCIVCGAKLFVSDHKYNSGCGWPAFFKGQDGKIDEHTDLTFGMKRVEVTCRECGAHLGHVFEDGPRDKGGMRYCINSASIDHKSE